MFDSPEKTLKKDAFADRQRIFINKETILRQGLRPEEFAGKLGAGFEPIFIDYEQMFLPDPYSELMASLGLPSLDMRYGY